MIYGELIRAQLQLSGSDLTPAVMGLIYFDSSALVPKVYTGAAWETLVDTNSSQVLTNKDYDGGTAANTSRLTLPKASTSTLSGLTRKQGTLVYDTDLNAPFIDNGTTLQAFGSGSGEVNLIDNSSDAGNWAASGAGVTVVTSTTSTDLPLAGVVDTAIKITPVSSTDYARYRFTISASLKNKKLKLEWYQRPLSGYASGDFKVEVYKNSASNYGGSYTEFSLSTDSSGTSSIPNLAGKFTTYFDADDADYYEIRIVRTAGTTALNIANVIVGPGIQPQGAVIGEWQAFTPTGSWSSNSTYSGFWRRVGSDAELFFQVTVSGAPTSATLSFNMPTGMTINTAALPSNAATSSGQLDFIGSARDSGTATYIAGARYTSTSAIVATVYATSSFATPSDVTQSNPMTWANGDWIFIKGKLPISEWANSGVVNLAQNDVEYASNSGTWDADDTSSFAYGPSGNAFGGALTTSRSKRVQFVSPILVSDKLELEVSEDRVKWYPISQGSLNGNPVIPSMSSLATLGTSSGAWVTTNGLSDSRQATVTFARYQQLANDDTPANNWESSNAYWRVKKISGGSAVGFGLADSNGNAGLVKRPLSQVRVDTGNGHGSTNTKIRRFSSIALNTGSAITYADSSTNGGSFTISEAGIYAITYTDFDSGTAKFGISVNSSELTTSVASMSATDRLIMCGNPSSSQGNCAYTGRFSAGDVVRAHTDGAINGSSALVQFSICQIFRL